MPPFGAPIVPNEVILDIPSSMPASTLDRIAASHSMTRVEITSFRLTGRTMHRWRINGGVSVADMIRNLVGDRQVAGAGANYLTRWRRSRGYLPTAINMPLRS